MKKSWRIVKEFISSGKKSKVVSLKLPPKDIKEAREININDTSIKLRLVKVELPNGGYEILLTSLLNEKKVTVSDMKQLYAMRWMTETSFIHLKHKAYIEIFTEK